MQIARCRLLREILLVTALVFCAAHAAIAQDDKYYVGLSVGQSNFKGACDGLDPSNGFIGSCKDKDTAYKIYGGVNFNKYWAGEIGYVDFGKATADGTFLGGPANARTKASGLILDAMGSLPLGEHFSLFAKVGILGWFVDSSATLAGFGNESASSNGASLAYGAGAQFYFTKAFGIRAEWEHFDKVGDDTTGKADIEMASVGLVYRF